jgi:hypothetical protein
MRRLRRAFLKIMPQRWATAMEAESRRWMMQCPCGFEISIWDAGGLRYKATGRKRVGN